MEFYVTKKNKSQSLLLIYFGIVIYFGIIAWASFYPFRWYFIIGMGIFFIFLSIGPGIYLYREYMKFNKDCSLSIDITRPQMTFRNSNGESMDVKFDSIEKINVYLSNNNYRNNAFTPAQVFSYARFTQKDGREIYITCLMIPKLKVKDFVQEYFHNVPVEFHHWWVFPSIRLCNYFRKKEKIPERYQ